MDDDGLRGRLVQAGVELVAEGGSAAVSLREIARRAGVSHGAPRRYFPTHLELLSAVAREGFADLGARLAAAGEPGDPRAALAAQVRAYVRFAQERRGMYELMFRHDLLRSDRLGLRDVTRPLFAGFADRLSRFRPAAPAIAAGALWANVHGIVQLWQWGALELTTGEASLEALLDAALTAHTAA